AAGFAAAGFPAAPGQRVRWGSGWVAGGAGPARPGCAGGGPTVPGPRGRGRVGDEPEAGGACTIEPPGAGTPPPLPPRGHPAPPLSPPPRIPPPSRCRGPRGFPALALSSGSAVIVSVRHGSGAAGERLARGRVLILDQPTASRSMSVTVSAAAVTVDTPTHAG